jgi:hypothetical protein
MLAQLRRLLQSETAADIETALASIDLIKLRADLSTATAQRADLLLSGTDAQVIAAGQAVETASIALERAEAAKAQLETKLAAAQAAEAEADFRARYAAVVALRDGVVAKIGKDYAAGASKILNVLEADREATAALQEINKAAYAGEAYDLPVIETASRRVWGAEFASIQVGVASMADMIRLLPTSSSAGHNVS